MKLFKNDHPRTKAPPGVLSQEEIRFYLKELIENPAFGWSHAYHALEVAFGMSQPRKHWLRTKLKRAWIYPGEQIRFSRAIQQILAGELVPKRVINPDKRRVVWMPARADVPVPLKVARGGCWKVDLTSGRLGFLRTEVTFTPEVPSFSTWMKTPKGWIPPGDRR